MVLLGWQCARKVEQLQQLPSGSKTAWLGFVRPEPQFQSCVCERMEKTVLKT